MFDTAAIAAKSSSESPTRARMSRSAWTRSWALPRAKRRGMARWYGRKAGHYASAPGLRLEGSRGLERLPDPLRRRGHVDVPDAEVRQRVDDRVLHGRGGADRAGLSDPLGAERVVGGRRLHVGQLEAGHLGGRDEGVVGEG